MTLTRRSALCGRLGDLTCAIGGVVVHDDQLEVDVLLGEQRLDRTADIFCFVASGHDDRDLVRARRSRWTVAVSATSSA